MELLRELIEINEAQDYHWRLSRAEWEARIKKHYPTAKFADDDHDKNDGIAEVDGSVVGHYDAQQRAGWMNSVKSVKKPKQTESLSEAENTYTVTMPDENSVTLLKKQLYIDKILTKTVDKTTLQMDLDEVDLADLREKFPRARFKRAYE